MMNGCEGRHLEKMPHSERQYNLFSILSRLSSKLITIYENSLERKHGGIKDILLWYRKS